MYALWYFGCVAVICHCCWVHCAGSLGFCCRCFRRVPAADVLAAEITDPSNSSYAVAGLMLSNIGQAALVVDEINFSPPGWASIPDLRLPLIINAPDSGPSAGNELSHHCNLRAHSQMMLVLLLLLLLLLHVFDRRRTPRSAERT